MRLLPVLLSFTFILNISGSFAKTSEPPTSSRELKFENNEIKVWKTVIEPGHPFQQIHHPHPIVAIPLKGGDLLWKKPDGTESIQTFKEGEAYWIPEDKIGEFHSVSEVSDKPMEIMVIELKNIGQNTKGEESSLKTKHEEEK